MTSPPNLGVERGDTSSLSLEPAAKGWSPVMCHIMDGNGRFRHKRGLPALRGTAPAPKRFQDADRGREAGIAVLTLTLSRG